MGEEDVSIPLLPIGDPDRRREVTSPSPTPVMMIRFEAGPRPSSASLTCSSDELTYFDSCLEGIGLTLC
jgi:hypothetical protein